MPWPTPWPMREKTISLYVHVPFCQKKCSYCAFASNPLGGSDLQAWFQALLLDLERQSVCFCGSSTLVSSIFFGGGTPSILPPDMVGQILAKIDQLWTLQGELEITLEANPESTTLAKLEDWRSFGINRLSLGVQALVDSRLALLGRPHDVLQARRVYDYARDAGFETVSLDLIHGSPGHTLQMWEDELGLAVGLGPDHISCYSLTVEPETCLAQMLKTNRAQLPDEETATALYFLTRQFLEEHGWQRYEISNYARNHRHCQHNLGIWLSGNYLGIGPAAHGRIILDDGSVVRSINHWPTTTYCRTLALGHGPFSWVELSSREEAAADCLLMGLRLVEGIPRNLYRTIAGQDLVEKKGREVEFLVNEGLMVLDENTIRMSDRGLDFLDTCLTWII